LLDSLHLEIIMSRQKHYCVKPVALVRNEKDRARLSRVKSLGKIAASRIANFFSDTGLYHEDKTSTTLNILLDYFHSLPLILRESVYYEMQDTLISRQDNAFSITSEHVSRSAADFTSFLPWKLLHSHSKILNLSELFTEGVGGGEIFQHIVESDSEKYSHFSRVILSSCDVSTNLSYIYQVTDSIWKPQLEVFLDKLTNISHLTLKYFCDDDTLAMVGKLCKNLHNLEIQLLPETVKDQQLTDDGFDDFIQYQLRNPSLKEINLKECYSHSITSRSTISLSEIPTLHCMHIRSFHLSWISLQICNRKRDTFPASQTLKHISINFFTNGSEVLDTIKNCFDVVPEPRFVQFLLDLIPLIFNKLETIHLDGIHGDLLPVKDETFRFLKNVVTMRIKKFPRLLDLTPYLYCLEDLEIHHVPFIFAEKEDKIGQNCYFPNLRKLTIYRDGFRHSILLSDLIALINLTPALKQLKIHQLTLKSKFNDEIVNSEENEFINLFQQLPHLKNLTSLDLFLGNGSILTERTVRFLIDTCPHLETIQNLLYWGVSLDALDITYINSQGFCIKFASRYHWGLHWKGDDGVIHDPDVPLDRF